MQNCIFIFREYTIASKLHTFNVAGDLHMTDTQIRGAVNFVAGIFNPYERKYTTPEQQTWLFERVDLDFVDVLSFSGSYFKYEAGKSLRGDGETSPKLTVDIRDVNDELVDKVSILFSIFARKKCKLIY